MFDCILQSTHLTTKPSCCTNMRVDVSLEHCIPATPHPRSTTSCEASVCMPEEVVVLVLHRIGVFHLYTIKSALLHSGS